MLLEVYSDMHLSWLHGDKQCSLQLSRPTSYHLTTCGLLGSRYRLHVAALLVCRACLSVCHEHVSCACVASSEHNVIVKITTICILCDAGFLVDKNSCSVIPVILSGATHSVDCLDAVAAAFTPSLSQANVPCFLTPSRPQEMSLYREWRGLSPDCDAQVPDLIPVVELLGSIGVPVSEFESASARLAPDACVALLKAALGAPHAAIRISQTWQGLDLCQKDEWLPREVTACAMPAYVHGY